MVAVASSTSKYIPMASLAQEYCHLHVNVEAHSPTAKGGTGVRREGLKDKKLILEKKSLAEEASLQTDDSGTKSENGEEISTSLARKTWEFVSNALKKMSSGISLQKCTITKAAGKESQELPLVRDSKNQPGLCEAPGNAAHQDNQRVVADNSLTQNPTNGFKVKQLILRR